jgi:sulfite reductase (NADPH) flavoprotein alpha-component
VYVQDRIREHGELVVDLITRRSAHVYVCGDGASMAKDVDATLRQVLQTHGKFSGEEAQGYLMEMRQRRRYLQDIWS